MSELSGFESLPLPNWAPFAVCANGEKPPYLRAISTPEGLGDRFRFVAFAEKQASLAFGMAPEAFPEVSDGVKEIWRILAQEENKHLTWLLWRMEELGVPVHDKPVSDALWKSFYRCKNAEEFALFMANAEERGRVAGEQFYSTLLKIDQTSAKLFFQIAKEEHEHIKLAKMITDLNFQIPSHLVPTLPSLLEVLPLQAYSDLKRAE